MKRVHLLISGDVQGVGYRYSAVEKAKELSLMGWAKNVEDKKVEIVAEGEEDLLNKLIAWCKAGPSFAKVGDLEIDWEKPTEEFSTFDIRY